MKANCIHFVLGGALLAATSVTGGALADAYFIPEESSEPPSTSHYDPSSILRSEPVETDTVRVVLPLDEIRYQFRQEVEEPEVVYRHRHHFSEPVLAFGNAVFLMDGDISWGSQGPEGVDEFESVAVPIRATLPILSEHEAALGYRFRERSLYRSDLSGVGAVPDHRDHYFFAGLRGQLFRSVFSYDIDAGVQERRTLAEGHEARLDALSFTARLGYMAAANRTYYAILARDFGSIGRDHRTLDQTHLTLGGRYRVSDVWTALFGITYSFSAVAEDGLIPTSMQGDEDFFVGRLGLHYSPNEKFIVEGSYQFADLEGSNAFSRDQVDPHRLSVSASLRY